MAKKNDTQVVIDLDETSIDELLAGSVNEGSVEVISLDTDLSTEESEVVKGKPADKPKAANDEPEIDFTFEYGELPPRGTGGAGVARGSKYGFEKFPKPTDPKKLPMLFVPAGSDPEKTKRSIYSAVTVQNRKAKEPGGDGAEFQTRRATDKPGFYIIRVK